MLNQGSHVGLFISLDQLTKLETIFQHFPLHHEKLAIIMDVVMFVIVGIRIGATSLEILVYVLTPKPKI